jgi:hypothetical protein
MTRPSTSRISPTSSTVFQVCRFTVAICTCESEGVHLQAVANAAPM